MFSRHIERVIVLIPRVALKFLPMFVPLKMAPGRMRGLLANQRPAFDMTCLTTVVYITPVERANVIGSEACLHQIFEYQVI